jgi:hypothetical protein
MFDSPKVTVFHLAGDHSGASLFLLALAGFEALGLSLPESRDGSCDGFLVRRRPLW